MPEKTIKLFTALAAFQQECPAIFEGSTGYGYKYADLKQILSVINPLMKKHKLGFTQLLNDNKITTVVFHTVSGESIYSEVTIPEDVKLNGMNKFQVVGSGITYYRRYSLSAILGLVTDADNDANPNIKKEEKTPAAPKKSAIEKARPKAPESKGSTSKKWITQEQFEAAKACTDPKLIENVFNKFQFRKIEQQEELQEIYNNLKSKNQ